MLTDGYIQQNGVNKIKRNISVTDDLLWLIGLYIADGSSEGGVRVEFSLNCTTKKEAAVREAKRRQKQLEDFAEYIALGVGVFILAGLMVGGIAMYFKHLR
jgi:hypothetical protein